MGEAEGFCTFCWKVKNGAKKKNISTKKCEEKSCTGRHSGKRRGSGGCLAAALLSPTVPAITYFEWQRETAFYMFSRGRFRVFA